MSDFEELMAQLKQKRDELKVQMHLATQELHDQWDELEEKMTNAIQDFLKLFKAEA